MIGIETLEKLEPLSRLSRNGVREVAGLCRHVRGRRGSDPCRAGATEGESLYLVKGELLLNFADRSSEVLVGGTDAAARPLGTKRAGIVSAKAITDVELIRIDDDVLDIMLTWDQLTGPESGGGEGTGEIPPPPEKPDWRSLTGVYTIQNLTEGIFAALPPANIEPLLDRFERVFAKRGEVIVRQGESGDFYYVIERGRCEVVRRVAGADVVLAELKAGDAFGEEALLAETTRNATVTMRSDGVLLRLAKDDFSALLREPLLHRVSLPEAREKAARGAVWMDVRYPAEYCLERMEGAINIPLNEIRNALGSIDSRQEYIVYCHSGRRSSVAAFLMSQRGIRAWLLDGGLRRWAREIASGRGAGLSGERV